MKNPTTDKTVRPPLMGGTYVLYLKMDDGTHLELGRSTWGPFWTEMFQRATEVYDPDKVSYEFVFNTEESS